MIVCVFLLARDFSSSHKTAGQIVLFLCCVSGISGLGEGLEKAAGSFLSLYYYAREPDCDVSKHAPFALHVLYRRAADVGLCCPPLVCYSNYSMLIIDVNVSSKKHLLCF